MGDFMRIDRKWLFTAGMAYIYLPMFFFILGWTKLILAVPTILICLFYFFRLRKEANDSYEDITVQWPVLLAVSVLFILIGYYAGYGRFINQPADWTKHNAILHDLAERNWPVLYSNKGEHSMLTYYIGQYILPSLAGKIFHSARIAELALYIWNVIGIVLVYLNVLLFTRATHVLKQLAFAGSFPFFSLPLWLSEIVLKLMTKYNSAGDGQWFFCADGIQLQYSNNYTLLKWVFPQTIPIWLMLIVFLLNREKVKYYVFLLTPVLLFGTLTFLGILPLAAVGALKPLFAPGDRTNGHRVTGMKARVKSWLYQLVSPANLTVFFSMGMLTVLYLLGNVTGEKPAELGLKVMPYNGESIVLYLVFTAVLVLPYAFILFRRHKQNWTFYVSIASLLVLPLFKMGLYNDLTMRASIPALFILMIYVIDDLFLRLEKLQNRKYIRQTILDAAALLVTLALLTIGARYPLAEMLWIARSENYSALGSGDEWNTLEKFANRSLENVDQDVRFNYYTYDLDNSFFYRYLIKTR